MGIYIILLLVIVPVIIFISARKSLSGMQKILAVLGILLAVFLGVILLFTWGWERGRDPKRADYELAENPSYQKTEIPVKQNIFEIDSENLNDISTVKTNTKTGKKHLKFRGKLTNVYRYMMLYDEKSAAVKSYLVDLGLKGITTKIQIKSPNNDTLYHFPIRNAADKILPEKLGGTHTFCATLFTDSLKNRKAVVIDSIK